MPSGDGYRTFEAGEVVYLATEEDLRYARRHMRCEVSLSTPFTVTYSQVQTHHDDLAYVVHPDGEGLCSYFARFLTSRTPRTVGEMSRTIIRELQK